MNSKHETVESHPDRREAVWQRSLGTLLTLLAVTALVLVLLLVAIGLWWNGVRTQHDARSFGKAAIFVPQPASPAPVPVAVVSVRRIPHSETVSLPVTWQPDLARPVLAPRDGALVWMSVRPGDQVNAGETVAALTATDRVAQLTPSPRLTSTRRTTRTPSIDAEIQRAVQRLEQAEKAVRAAETALADSVEAAIQPATRPVTAERAGAERRVARARAELAEREAVLRETRRLWEAGAASRAELREDTAARDSAAQELARAEAHALEAPAPVNSGEDTGLSAARARLVRARRESAAARASLRASRRKQAAAGPAPQARRVTGSETGTARLARAARTLGWRELSRRIPIRAPMTGIVSRVSVSAGAPVTRGQRLFWLTAGSSRIFRAVGPDRLRLLRVGTPARLRAPGGSTIRARVRAVRPMDREKQVQVTVHALESLPNSWGVSGLRLELDLPSEHGAVVVPEQAVRRRGTTPEAWIVRPITGGGGGESWIARRRRLLLGPKRGGKVTVHAGLQPDDRVIVAGMERLREGQKVAAIPWTLP